MSYKIGGRFTYSKRACKCTNCGGEIEKDDIVWIDLSKKEILDSKCARMLKRGNPEKQYKGDEEKTS